MYASWLAIGGVSIGFASLVLTACIIQGFEDVISEKLSSFEGYGRINHVLGQTIDISEMNIDSLNYKLQRTVTPFIRGVAMLRFGSKAEGIIIEGKENLSNSITMGEISNRIHSGKIIIGMGLAKTMGIKTGDKVFLQGLLQKESVLYFPKIQSLEVAYIYYSGLQEFDNTLAYISIEDAQSILDYTDNSISGFIVENDSSNEFSIEINYPYYFETWKEKHSLLFDWISLQRWPAYIMFGLIALVGMVNLIAAIAMIIIEKSNNIGILLAQGMSKSEIKYIFFLHGGFIGLLGGIIGGIFSIIIIKLQLRFQILKIPADIYFMDQIPFSFNYSVFFALLILSFIIAVISTWFPIKTISSFRPSVILRYE